MFKAISNYFNKKNLKNDKYLYLFDQYDGDEFICFDCETTGLNPKVDDIISIGALKIKNNKILTSQKFERFIKPKSCKLQADSIKVHHIRECDLNDAKEIDEVIDEFLDFIGNRPLVGYYLEFDVAMVNKYIKSKLGIKLPNKQIEVSALYYDYKIEFIPQGNIDLRFDTILKELKVPRLGKHDAINDAIMTAMMFIKLQNQKK
ncbi:MAG: 3'-5' exonuclease [Arcobacter butzleri]|nr:3'-5' exonuclease [Aliarcobacter butzleri]